MNLYLFLVDLVAAALTIVLMQIQEFGKLSILYKLNHCYSYRR